MTSAQKDKMISDHLTIKFNFIDLFYAYCRSKGYDDPECDIENDEEYDRLERECEDKITYELVAKLGEAIMHDGMERINNLWM